MDLLLKYQLLRKATTKSNNLIVQFYKEANTKNQGCMDSEKDISVMEIFIMVVFNAISFKEKVF